MDTRIKYTCPGCDKQRIADDDLAGFEYACTTCKTMIVIPSESGMALEVTPKRKKKREKTVPVGLQMPNGLGGMQVEVTQQTANSMATTFLGGILVAIGVTLAAFFGGKGKS